MKPKRNPTPVMIHRIGLHARLKIVRNFLIFNFFNLFSCQIPFMWKKYFWQAMASSSSSLNSNKNKDFLGIHYLEKKLNKILQEIIGIRNIVLLVFMNTLFRLLDLVLLSQFSIPDMV